MTDETLTLLFQKESLPNRTTIIQLENKHKLPVGALYLNGDNPDKIVVCQTSNTDEKYYIYMPCVIGKVAVFFTYWKVVNQ